MTQMPPPPPLPRTHYTPHRGAMILVLGLLGLMMCGLLGIFAWVMGNNDLAEIRAGRMDPEGEGLTSAGRILGIVSVVLMLIPLVIIAVVLVFMAIFAGIAAVAHG